MPHICRHRIMSTLQEREALADALLNMGQGEEHATFFAQLASASCKVWSRLQIASCLHRYPGQGQSLPM